MPIKISFKTNILEFFNLICLLVIVLVIPILTAGAFQLIDQNAVLGKKVLGISSVIDPTGDNTSVISNVSDKISTINDNTVATKILIVIGATFFAITLFLVVTLISHIYEKPDEEKKDMENNILLTEEPRA